MKVDGTVVVAGSSWQSPVLGLGRTAIVISVSQSGRTTQTYHLSVTRGWPQQAYLKASATHAGAQLGYSVAISGDTLVVGAPHDPATADDGAAYVFVRSGASWTRQAVLESSDPQLTAAFGYSVSISGDTIVVGAPEETSGSTGVNSTPTAKSGSGDGAAYVFVRNNGAWTNEAHLKASNTDSGDDFGCSVSISGDTIAIGAYWEDSSATGVNGGQSDDASGYVAGAANAFNSGAVYVFVRAAGAWTQQAYLKASNTDGQDRFGWSVAISDESIVVGANYECSADSGVNGDQADDSAVGSGAAYVFVRSSGTWTQEAYLKASNAEAGDFFGVSVAISGDALAVGASFESSAATGVDGSQSNNDAPGSGAGYVFVRAAGVWTQQAYLKPSNNDPSSTYYFGSSVAISNTTTILGAYAEASNATGVDGNQADRSAAVSGAAYVFAR